MKRFLLPFLIAFVTSWMETEARLAKARRTTDGYVFGPANGIRLIYALNCALGMGLVVLAIRGPAGDRLEVAVGGLCFILLAVLTWPKPISTSSLGISELSWRWSWRLIPWSGVSEVKEKRDGSIIVRGNGMKMEHSQYHAGRDQFLEEIHRHLPRLRVNLPHESTSRA